MQGGLRLRAAVTMSWRGIQKHKSRPRSAISSVNKADSKNRPFCKWRYRVKTQATVNEPERLHRGLSHVD